MKNKLLVLLIFALVISSLFSLFASSYPDGLEASAEHIGLIAEKKYFFAFSPDYLLPGISNEILSASLASVIGTLLTFAIMFLFIKLLNKKQNKKIYQLLDTYYLILYTNLSWWLWCNG